MSNLEDIYAHLWTAHVDELPEFNQDQKPRGVGFMYELATEAGLGENDVVLDLGCGRGNHSDDLVRRFGCRVVGMDLVRGPVGKSIREAGSIALFSFVQGAAERMPFQSGSFNFIWCRDMLEHVANIDGLFRECARVLAGNGQLLVSTVLQTDLMEPHEAERLYSALAINPHNMICANLRHSFEQAGFACMRTEDVGSELIEFYEQKEHRASRELMRISRMRRDRAELTAKWGATRFESTLALYHWVVYFLLGKLSLVYYLLAQK